MKITNSQKIGIFVLAIAALLFFGLNFLKGYDLFGKKNVYYTYLSEVEGLTATSPIYIRGLKVGAIEKISLNPVKDSFLVCFSVKKDYLIPLDSRAEVYSSDLLGGKALRLALGESSIGAVNGDTLKGRSVPDMLSVLSGYMGPLKDQLAQTLDNLNTTLVSINATLDSSARENLHSSLRRLNGTLANVQNFSEQLNKMAPDLSASLKNINTISQELSSPQNGLGSAISNINKTAENLSSLKLAEMVDNLNLMIQKIQSPNSTTGKLMNTDSIHNSVDSLLNEIDDLVKKIKSEPKKYLRLSVF